MSPLTTPEPHYRDAAVTLYTGDATDVLATLPAASVNCLVTSPPYYGLRDYGTATWSGGDPDCAHTFGTPQNTRPVLTYPPAAHRGTDPSRCPRCGARRLDRQYGLEATPEQYVDNLRWVFAQVHRVLADDGTAWLNLGDSYYSGKGAAGGVDHKQPARRFGPRPLDGPSFGARRKSLLGMPWRVAAALAGDGWILRNAIVWHKPNAMPESVRDRMSCRYELVFLLTKSERYWFDLDPIREPVKHPEARNRQIVFGGSKIGDPALRGASRRRRGGVYGNGAVPGQAARRIPTVNGGVGSHPAGRNPGDVWSLNTRPFPGAHFACFPIDLPLRCIAAGCPPGGVVLDCFSGAGTTALAARQLGRTYIGVDLNPEFHRLALARLAAHTRTGSPGGS